MTRSQLPLRSLLCVEDDPGIREVIEEWAEGEGVPCFSAANGEEALRICEKEQPCAVISDINMPVLSGLEFLKRLRSQGSDAPVIFITGDDSKERIQEALRLGAFDFIAKPFTIQTLQKTIIRALEVGFRIKRIQESLNELDTSGEIREGVNRQLRAIALFKAKHGSDSNKD